MGIGLSLLLFFSLFFGFGVGGCRDSNVMFAMVGSCHFGGLCHAWASRCPCSLYSGASLILRLPLLSFSMMPMSRLSACSRGGRWVGALQLWKRALAGQGLGFRLWRKLQECRRGYDVQTTSFTQHPINCPIPARSL